MLVKFVRGEAQTQNDLLHLGNIKKRSRGIWPKETEAENWSLFESLP